MIKKKKWYRQRTTWTGALSIFTGGILCATGNVAAGGSMIVNGAGFIFGRQAINAVIDNVANVAGTVSEVADAVKK